MEIGSWKNHTRGRRLPCATSSANVSINCAGATGAEIPLSGPIIFRISPSFCDLGGCDKSLLPQFDNGAWSCPLEFEGTNIVANNLDCFATCNLGFTEVGAKRKIGFKSKHVFLDCFLKVKNETSARKILMPSWFHALSYQYRWAPTAFTKFVMQFALNSPRRSVELGYQLEFLIFEMAERSEAKMRSEAFWRLRTFK